MTTPRGFGTIDGLVRQAAHSLLQHRLRASLSALGLVCGVATVITAMAIADGAQRAALDEFGALGTTNVFVRQTDGAAAPTLAERDLAVIRGAVPGVAFAAATRLARTEASTGQRHVATSLAGVTSEWPHLSGVSVAEGHWWTDDVSHATRRVAVLGAAITRELFGGASPLGERVQCGGAWYLVVGTLAARGTSGRTALFDTDHAVLVPFLAMDTSQGVGDSADRARELAFQMRAADAVDAAAPVIAAAIARQHGDTPGIELVVPRELLRARLRTQRTTQWLLMAVGGMALFISGIGIMNIMLASITERTHEIGVRRTVGARRPDIVAQFACEAALLCLTGGAAGVPIGALLSVAIAFGAGWPVAVSAGSVALALATATGLAFGIYPARVAARISPIDALRF